MKKKRINNNYTYEFKKEICEKYLSGKYGGGMTFCRRFSIRSKRQLYNWVNLYHKDPELLKVDGRHKGKADGINKGKPKQLDLTSLSKDKQIEHLRMENDILKKAKALRKRYGEH